MLNANPCRRNLICPQYIKISWPPPRPRWEALTYLHLWNPLIRVLTLILSLTRLHYRLNRSVEERMTSWMREKIIGAVWFIWICCTHLILSPSLSLSFSAVEVEQTDTSLLCQASIKAIFALEVSVFLLYLRLLTSVVDFSLLKGTVHPKLKIHVIIYTPSLRLFHTCLWYKFLHVSKFSDNMIKTVGKSKYMS